MITSELPIRAAKTGLAIYLLITLGLFALAALPELARILDMKNWPIANGRAIQTRDILTILTPFAIYAALVLGGATSRPGWIGLIMAMAFALLPIAHIWTMLILVLVMCVKPSAQLRFPQLAAPARTESPSQAPSVSDT